MELVYTLITLFGCSAVWLLPTALTAAAIVDMVRVRAEWYWCFIIFGIPVLGALAYFAVHYLPMFGSSQTVSTLSPTAYRRNQARRRLKELQIQLQHWRGPAVLAEAGAQLLVLGKLGQAEELLREAKQAGADIKDANFDLAQVLQVKGRRWREALPLFQELVELEPDARFGSARLGLARCLDENGDKERAEEELRAVLRKRNPPEAKVRLARILLTRGERQEATELLAEVRADAAMLPKYLAKEHGPWIRKAGKLKGETVKLPSPTLEGAPPKRSPTFLAAAAIGVVMLALALFAAGRFFVLPLVDAMDGMGDMSRWYQLEQDNQRRLDGLTRALPAYLQGDVPDAAAVQQILPRLLDARRDLAAACGPASDALEEHRNALRSMRQGNDWEGGLSFSRRVSEWQRAQAVFGSTYVDVLETHSIAPSDAERLFALCDGAFLGREGARILTIPSHFRADYSVATATLAEPLPPRTEPEWRRDVIRRQEQQRAKMTDLEKMAVVEIPEELRQFLETQRAELESSFEDECLAALVRVLEPELAWHSEPVY
ncbi:MAG: tetratricopeptide repeat protein [Thermoanaerobaculia bacterium]|nr:tetratricopeptide repeat protein [Thermoanaerobaculia bacterium]